MTTKKCNKITPHDADIYPTYENMAEIEFKMQMAIDNPGMYTLEELQAMQCEYDEHQLQLISSCATTSNPCRPRCRSGCCNCWQATKPTHRNSG